MAKPYIAIRNIYLALKDLRNHTRMKPGCMKYRVGSVMTSNNKTAHFISNNKGNSEINNG